MLIKNDDDTCTGGPLDVIAILHDVPRGTYHAAFFEEHPPPGRVLLELASYRMVDHGIEGWIQDGRRDSNCIQARGCAMGARRSGWRCGN